MVTINEAYQAGYDAGYSAALDRVREMEQIDIADRSTRIGTSDVKEHVLWGQPATPAHAPKRPRKVSAYHKRLGRAIKALRAKHLLKSGKWRKGWNQKKMMKAAHKVAKRG